MGTLLTALLGAVSVAIISGGDLPQFKEYRQGSPRYPLFPQALRLRRRK
jgi:hypothetical protein